MHNRTLNEYAPSAAPHDARRDSRDDVGRDVDHRPTPGAFGHRDDGFVMGSAIADPEDYGPAVQAAGAVHHKEDVVLKPGTPPKVEPEAEPEAPADAKASVKAKAAGAAAKVEHVAAETAKQAAETAKHAAQSAKVATQAAKTEVIEDAKGIFARIERLVWSSSVVQRVLTRIAQGQKKSAEHIEDWLEAPGLFRH